MPPRFLAALASVAALALPAGTATADDSVPTDWMRQIRSEALLTAPSLNAPTAICVVDTGVNLTPDLQGAVTNRVASAAAIPATPTAMPATAPTSPRSRPEP